MTLSYDGTRYGGWQIQPNAPSIQSLIENALLTILRQKTPIVGAGRTDAGVHAKGQVAHFKALPTLNLYLLFRSMNGILPADIRLLRVEPVTDTFHARYSASSKEYHYHIYLDQALDPFKRLYVYHHPYPLNLDVMQQACALFTGSHDFTSFANEASKGSAAKNPVRMLHRLEIYPEAGGLRLEFEGDGFLYKMVRNITGALIEVGRGKLSLAEIPILFDMKDRRKACFAVPSRGLFLMKVNYAKSSDRRASNEGTQILVSELDSLSCGWSVEQINTGVATPASLSD